MSLLHYFYYQIHIIDFCKELVFLLNQFKQPPTPLEPLGLYGEDDSGTNAELKHILDSGDLNDALLYNHSAFAMSPLMSPAMGGSTVNVKQEIEEVPSTSFYGLPPSSEVTTVALTR